MSRDTRPALSGCERRTRPGSDKQHLRFVLLRSAGALYARWHKRHRRVGEDEQNRRRQPPQLPLGVDGLLVRRRRVSRLPPGSALPVAPIQDKGWRSSSNHLGPGRPASRFATPAAPGAWHVVESTAPATTAGWASDDVAQTDCASPAWATGGDQTDQRHNCTTRVPRLKTSALHQFGRRPGQGTSPPCSGQGAHRQFVRQGREHAAGTD